MAPSPGDPDTILIPRKGRNHVVVIGGSIAGLVCARVLSDHFARVTVLERDSRPERPEPRKGAPQMRHAHAVLGGAKEGFCELFPGFLAELREGGAVVFDAAADVAMYHYGAWKPRFRSGMEAVCCSRPFIEWHVRRRVHALPNVEIRYEHTAESLLTTGHRGHVRGVLVKSSAGEDSLDADLVVDAAGRGSRAPRWLDALGYGRPPEEEVGIDLAYTSRILKIPPGYDRKYTAMAIYCRPPAQRGAFVFEIEGDRWLVSLPGYFGDHCPTDEAGFLEFARSLPVSEVASALLAGEPETPIVIHKIPGSRWLHYEKMKALPSGLVMLGDSVCALNPIYGQGMMVAVQCALAFRNALVQWPHTDLHGFPLHVQKELAKVIQLSWMLSTTMDLSFSKATGHRPPWLAALQWTFTSLIELTSKDEHVCRVFYDLLHARTGMEALASPKLLLPLLAHSAKRPFTPQEQRMNVGPLPLAPA